MMVFLRPLSEKFLCWKASSTQMLSSKYQINLKISNVDYNYRLKEVIYQDDNLYLIFEYCEYDLKKYMRKIGGPLPASTVKKFNY